jgi:hypothetical protein
LTGPDVALIRGNAADIAPNQTVVSTPAGMDAGWSPCLSGEGIPMSQGKRGGRARKLIVAVGAALCVTIIGCNEIDKPKLGSTKQPGPGLPGTPTLSGQPGTGAVRTGQPATGLQPLGGTASPVGRNTTGGYPASGNTTFGSGSGGNSMVPSVSPSNNDFRPNSNAPISPAAGMGAAAPSGSFGGASAPLLDTPGLTPPASPGAVNGVVTPPGGPVAPTYPQ